MIAFVREVSRSLAQCELSYLPPVPIDVARAAQQQRAYAGELERLGCRLEWLPPLPEQPDGVFVEDTAVVLPELAVLTRPGVASRRGEVASVGPALARHVKLARIEAPGTLEGGDVLLIGKRLYVGSSGRTNAAGVAQLAGLLAPFGYEVNAVAMQGCLHLKSACTFVPPDVLLVNPAWVDPRSFRLPRAVAVDSAEPFGANSLTIGSITLVSADYPRTQQALEAAGITTRALKLSELHKAEAALTCLSLLL